MDRIYKCKQSCTITDIFSLYVIQCMDRKDILCITDFYPKHSVSLSLHMREHYCRTLYIFLYRQQTCPNKKILINPMKNCYTDKELI